MVGVSLIVYIATRLESVRDIWDLPTQLPEVFVWTREYVPGETIERVRRIPGVSRLTVSTDVDCDIDAAAETTAADSVVARFLRKLTRPVFVAGEPEELLSMVKVAFVEGTQAEVIARLKRGGHVAIPPQTARNHNLHPGDRLTIAINRRAVEFEVAGVVQSPALDLAVTAFQAESYMQFASASAVLGTREDLKNKFGLDVVSMFMADLGLSPAPVPAAFDPRHLPRFSDDAEVAAAVAEWADGLPEEADTIQRVRAGLAREEPAGSAAFPEDVRAELRRFARALNWLHWAGGDSGDDRTSLWTGFRERLLILRIAYEIGRPDAVMGSLRRMRAQIDARLNRAMAIVTWLPSVLLVAASIGVANLMMVSVHLRARSMAMLRAIGAERSQIVRMVLAEAVTIGLLGGVMGLALGFHEAWSVNRITEGVLAVSLKFLVPVGTTLLAVGLTIGVCLLAGVGPARYAARENILEALQVT
jgi:ABC-type lipoprotein release transport system permease subunit